MLKDYLHCIVHKKCKLWDKASPFNSECNAGQYMIEIRNHIADLHGKRLTPGLFVWT